MTSSSTPQRSGHPAAVHSTSMHRAVASHTVYGLDPQVHDRVSLLASFAVSAQMVCVLLQVDDGCLFVHAWWPRAGTATTSQNACVPCCCRAPYHGAALDACCASCLTCVDQPELLTIRLMLANRAKLLTVPACMYYRRWRMGQRQRSSPKGSRTTGRSTLCQRASLCSSWTTRWQSSASCQRHSVTGEGPEALRALSGALDAEALTAISRHLSGSDITCSARNVQPASLPLDALGYICSPCLQPYSRWWAS